MTTFEERKAAALEDVIKFIGDAMYTVWEKCHNPKHEDGNTDWFNDTLPTVEAAKNNVRSKILDLLQPAPSDQEVERAISSAKWQIEMCEADQGHHKHHTTIIMLETLMRGAQHPRREWRTMEDAPRDGRDLLIYDGNSIWIGFYDIDYNVFLKRDFIDDDIPNGSHWQPLPEPPQVTK